VVVIIGLAAYHLVMVGIPILTGNVEVTRFDFTSSGLFGIPGRMYLFGLPFAVLLVSIGAGRNLLPVSRRLLVATWGAYILANLVGGLKGGMVNVLVTALLVAAVAGRPITMKRILAGSVRAPRTFCHRFWCGYLFHVRVGGCQQCWRLPYIPRIPHDRDCCHPRL